MDNLNAESARRYVLAEMERMDRTGVDIWDVRRNVEDRRCVLYVVTGDCVTDGAEGGTEVMSFEWVVWQEPDGQIMGEW